MRELECNKVFEIDRLPSRREIRQLSEASPGSFWYGDYFYTHHKNNKEVYTYITREHTENIISGRVICQKLTGIENVGWTYSRMARTCSDWLEVPHNRSEISPSFLLDWHYQKCLPCYPKRAIMYDLKSAYWNFLSMLPSPMVEIENGKFRCIWVSDEIETRWNSLKTELNRHKQIRLRFIGVNSSGWSGPLPGVSTRYCKGKAVPIGHYNSPLQSACILAVRATYEVTQLQSDQINSVYSNADCVVAEGNRLPMVWRDLGLRYSQKAHWIEAEQNLPIPNRPFAWSSTREMEEWDNGGIDDIHSIVAYKIGNSRTVGYDAISKMEPCLLAPTRITSPFIHPALLALRT